MLRIDLAGKLFFMPSGPWRLDTCHIFMGIYHINSDSGSRSSNSSRSGKEKIVSEDGDGSFHRNLGKLLPPVEL